MRTKTYSPSPAQRRLHAGAPKANSKQAAGWSRFGASATIALALTAGNVRAQTSLDEESPWPRVRFTNGNTVTLYLPQVESWTSNSFRARAAVEVKRANSKKESLGVVWIDAHGSVDSSNRIVALDQMEATKGRFPDAAENGSNELAIVRSILPSGACTVSLDYLITALGFKQAAARQGAAGLKHTPPQIIWTTNRAVLVLIDGEPVLRPTADANLERVLNTAALLVHEKASGRFYLAGEGQWFAADTIKGPWSLVQTPPADVAALSPPSTNAPAAGPQGLPPRIIVSTDPAELLLTGGLPDFRTIRGTSLQYAADTDSQLFFNTKEREAYLLLSGRWFKSQSLNGPWTHVKPHDLPEDFAKIPAGSPQGVVLASVPDTPQAELAVVAGSMPTTATVNRRTAKIDLSYEGEPKFKPIEGTTMSYAVNAQLPVIRLGDSYYALDNGVWFLATSPTGPWEVATEVPEEIYTIPPSSPVYYATFARVYNVTDDEVEVGYTPGYQGTYEDEGTVVYGTGWEYEPYYDDYYYGWGYTWGYGYWYVPWYGWWVWRPWWSHGGLRAALIENIYDRWQGRPGVDPHDRPGGTVANLAARTGAIGYPALYGRFRGSSGPAAMLPPANTLALNPYTRPKSAVRTGEIPKGAQLLTTVRQSPSRGRDLYASPDGNVYLRKNDGWYRPQAGGGWKFYAPLQGAITSDQVGQARGAQATAVRRIASAPNTAAAKAQARNRVPNVGGEARAEDVSALERQHYARVLGQMRSQNVQRSYGGARAARGGGFRRR